MLGSDKQADREEAIINARHEFCLKYMAEKGWGDDVTKLTIDQVLEINDQPEWQDPLKEAN